jgi:hypothetical protein
MTAACQSILLVLAVLTSGCAAGPAQSAPAPPEPIASSEVPTDSTAPREATTAIPQTFELTIISEVGEHRITGGPGITGSHSGTYQDIAFTPLGGQHAVLRVDAEWLDDSPLADEMLVQLAPLGDPYNIVAEQHGQSPLRFEADLASWGHLSALRVSVEPWTDAGVAVVTTERSTDLAITIDPR